VSPNAIAWLALAVWPLVALAVYYDPRSSRRLARTTAWLMILPVMFLPSAVAYKWPLVPAMDKHRIAFLAIVAGLLLFHRREIRFRVRDVRFPAGILLVIFLGVVRTVQTNPQALVYGPRTIPGLTSHDILSIAAAMTLDFFLPFVVGAVVFRREEDVRDLFDVLSLCGLIYMPFCLVEVRLSPQLHYWVYGFYQHEFAQSMRYGGFRPVVFMAHGLTVALFYFTSLLASLALWKVGARVDPPASVRVAVNGVVLWLAKSMGAVIYSIVAVVLMFFRPSRRSFTRVIVLMTLIVAIYPVTRAAGVFPRREIVAFFARINPERAESLDFRFQNEDALVARAMQRPVSGWGTFGRNRVYAEWGQDLSVTDGAWIILLGAFGVVGLVAVFALLLIPVFRFVRNWSRIPKPSRVLVGALALMVMLLIIDLLPNARSDGLILAYAGALYTLTGRLRREAPRRVPVLRTASEPGPGESRLPVPG
jgi:hypothetical protein